MPKVHDLHVGEVGGDSTPTEVFDGDVRGLLNVDEVQRLIDLAQPTGQSGSVGDAGPTHTR